VDYSDSHAFASGQTYVALSRCKSFSKLYLKELIRPEDVKVNQEVIEYMNDKFQPKVDSNIRVPMIEKTEKKSEIKWRSDNRIEAIDYKAHKKITGRRFPMVLNLSRWATPFEAWCAIMHVYEEPIDENNPKIKAGRIIEPKQFEYVKRVFADKGDKFISPTDCYGEDYMSKTYGDFFRYDERFGGMWDYLMERDGHTTMVFEMKTTGMKNRRNWINQIPNENVLQAALYAWLLNIDQFTMVCSFLEDKDYYNPDEFVCDSSNTYIESMEIDKYFPDFENRYIIPAMKWWDDYVDTGISPKYDTYKDKDILSGIRNKYSLD
jgi:hypothetical protein